MVKNVGDSKLGNLAAILVLPFEYWAAFWMAWKLDISKIQKLM